MPLFRSKAEDKVRNAGFDPARLPPGQYYTDKWPVLHAGDVPDEDLATWTLEISGEVENPVTLTYAELTALPATDVTTDIHCVTRWSRFDAQFKGVHWSELAKLCKPKPSARFAIAHAEQGFTANVPLAAIEDEKALVVYEADGAPLTPDHGWPVRLFVPSKYFWKSAKWLRGIELSAVDKPGFWERYGYHNDADYWQEERYGF
ncbi:MAG TPA: sulfite oxidase-like oxidoreductase [Gaiellaceae bacterium]|jgi:Sulfite oxidase and related enzymes|nr:sulfite oxidase-like oxidoreductase [Gaiellaceae bacterium]